MIVKIHKTSDERLILSICDDDLIGMNVEEAGKQLDLSSDFYKGEKMGEEEILKLIKKAYSLNAVGKDSVKCCLKSGVIDKNRVGKISNVPYAYMVRF